jgi:hypothetical protein
MTRIKRLAALALCCALTICAFPHDGAAYTEGLPTIDQAYARSDVVMSAVIETSKIHSANGVVCGTRYEAKISRLFKTDGHASSHSAILIGGADGLKIGREYLLFVQKISNAQEVYNRVKAELPYSDPEKKGALPNVPTQTVLDIIRCDGLVPGYKFDNLVAWPIAKGDVGVFGLWPKSAVPSSIQIDFQSGPYWMLRERDVFRYLDHLGSSHQK